MALDIVTQDIIIDETTGLRMMMSTRPSAAQPTPRCNIS